jgi:regulator of sigma E protease
MFYTLLSIGITLVLVVGFHEAGHAIAAKIFSIKIQRIAIGFGKPFVSVMSKSGCEWVLGRWPLGGYVQLLNTRIKEVAKKDWAYCFDKKPVWVRCVVLVSGGVMNLVVASLGFTLYYSLGYSQYPSTIKAVVPLSIAAQAGFKAQDSIIALNHKKIDTWQLATISLIASLGQENVVVSLKGPSGVTRALSLDLRPSKALGRDPWKSLGIEPDLYQAHVISGLTFEKAFVQAIGAVLLQIEFFIMMLTQLIMGHIPLSLLLGPIGIFKLAIDSFSHGVGLFSYFIASFSVGVGCVNLLPIPGLDGGAVIYAFVEKIRGKPVSVALEVLLYRLLMIVFCVFLVQLLVNDLQPS